MFGDIKKKKKNQGDYKNYFNKQKGTKNLKRELREEFESKRGQTYEPNSKDPSNFHLQMLTHAREEEIEGKKEGEKGGKGEEGREGEEG